MASRRPTSGRYVISVSRYVTKRFGGKLLLLTLLCCVALVPMLLTDVHHTVFAKQAAKLASLPRTLYTELVEEAKALAILKLPLTRKPTDFHIIEKLPPGTATYINYSDLQKMHDQRSQHMRNECAKQTPETPGSSSEEWALGRMEVEPNFKLLFCPLLKVGSTFWRRALYAMRKGKQLHSPYEVPIAVALNYKPPILTQYLPSEEEARSLVLGNLTKFMFVREPFSRLLSGYVDKLFTPNPYFWEVIGKYIVSKFRRNPSAKSIRCGHDVTFAEFVDYVIDSEMKQSPKRDAHFTPAHDQCRPCRINYDVIGKMETFGADVAHLLGRLDFNVSNQLLSEWASGADDDAINDISTSHFLWKKRIQRCMPLQDATRRVWRKLQIRGIIALENKFPFNSKQLRSLNSRTFSRAVRQLRAKSANSGTRRAQKRAALREAMSTLRPGTVDRLRDVFALDFALFGYDPDPIHLRRVSDQKMAPVFFDLSNV